jgi:vacuolar protein 8
VNSCNAENKKAIAEACGIEPLIALVRSGTDSQKEYAACALICLACNAENKKAIAEAGGIEPLIALVRSGTDNLKDNAASALKCLACNAKNKKAIAEAGGIFGSQPNEAHSPLGLFRCGQAWDHS